MSIERLSGGLTPADGADPRTFPAIWNATADDLEAGDYSRVPTGGSAGQVLVKDSGTDFDASWRFGFGALVASGRWHNFGGRGANTGAQPSQNELRLSPVFFAKPVVVNALGMRIGTSGTGSAGAVYRIGVYDSNDEGLPENLLLDAGTVDATQPAATVLTIIGLSLQLDTGFYWFGGALQGGAATAPFIVQNDAPYARIVNLSNQTADVPNNTATDSFTAQRVASVTGALPSTVSGTIPTGGPPLIIARFN
jgi:hypothetical protein